MKKFIFTALAVVAFSGTSMAAKKVVKIKTVKAKTTLAFDCMSSFRASNNMICALTGASYASVSHANREMLWACINACD